MSMHAKATKPFDILNHRFGKLTVMQKGSTDAKGNRLWLCKCECGNLKNVVQYKLFSGRTSSCGDKKRHTAMHIEVVSDNRKKKLRLELIGILARIHKKEKEAKFSQVRFKASVATIGWSRWESVRYAAATAKQVTQPVKPEGLDAGK